jgi:uncharacterized protein (DUF849 family)
MDDRVRIVDVALNGSRTDNEHPRIPRQPEELARAAFDAVAAGARVLHLHPHDAAGVETLEAQACAAAITAVRAACPEAPISLSTSAAIEPDPERRLELIAAWTVLPDLVTANQGEAGIVELCEELMLRGVGIEAGLLSWRDAEAFVQSGLPDRCVRVMFEPLDVDPDAAVLHAARIEEIVTQAGITLEQVHHGEGIACWAVNRRAVERGCAIRTGLEDTPVLPDGRLAADNAELVRVAIALP